MQCGPIQCRSAPEATAAVRPGYLNLDAKLIRAGIHTATGFEACDLLGPDNELLFIKRAESSEPLSHLFGQALVSVQTIMNSAEARAKFADRVKELSIGKRQLPQPYTPAKVIFGILLKNGKKLTPDTLFPFSQVTLAQTTRELQARFHITVEAVPVHAENVSASLSPRLSFKPVLVLAT